MRAILVAALLAALPTTVLAYTFDRDVPENIKNQIRNDMEFIRTIASDDTATPLHKEIFGNVNGPKYAEFFESRVTAVGMNRCGGGKAVACVIPMIDPSKIWLTQNYVQFSHPTIAKMMVVFHEARHTEVNYGNWSHATCPTPFKDKDGSDMKSIWTGASLAGEPACDITPYGSYGSSTIMLKNVQKFCTSCNEKVRMDAGIYADDQFKRITSANAIDKMKKDLYSDATL